MVILDEPVASEALLQWLEASQHSVLGNAFARQKAAEGHRLKLVDDAEGARRADEGERIYTCTENALAWIMDHSANEGLKASIQLFKDKGLMRERLSALNNGFFFRRVSRDELAAVDVDGLPLPVVLKPNVGFCSMGVYVVDSAEAWDAALADIERNESAWHAMYPESVVGAGEYLIEGYIEGPEFAVDAYYDEAGAPHILNIWRHDFASAEDTSDRLYLSSQCIVDETFDEFSQWLSDVNAIVGARSFCVHVELRRTDAGIIPIEFNPLRFAGLGGTDMAFYGCGYRTYECYLEGLPLDLRQVYRAHPTDVYSMSLLGRAGEGAFRYDAFAARFSDVLHFFRFDVDKVGSYGFLFLRTPVDDDAEREFLLHADLQEFLAQ